MAGEDSTMGMAVSEVVPVFPPSILTFAMTGGESAAAAEAAASLLSSAFLFGGIVGRQWKCRAENCFRCPNGVPEAVSSFAFVCRRQVQVRGNGDD